MRSTSTDVGVECTPDDDGRRVDRRVAAVAAVITILDTREDLRGVNALADHLDYAARWGT